MRKFSRKRAESVAVAALLLQFFFVLITAALTRWSGMVGREDLAMQTTRWTWEGSLVLWAAAAMLAIGLPVWLLSWVLLRQRRLAEEEAEEWQRLEAERRAGRGEQAALFTMEEDAAYVARKRLGFLEKYMLRAGSVLVVGLFGYAGVSLFLRRLAAAGGANPERAQIAAAFLAFETFALFLCGMYAKGMSKQPEWRPLRAGASYMLGSAAALLIAAAALAALGLKVHYVEWVGGYVVPAALCLFGVEVFINFVLDFYRPRVEGVESRPSYDSRLLGLIAEPSGILRTVASTLDYQFGFKVSETWFYRFLEGAIAPLLLFWLATFYLLTCIIVVEPGQRVLVERWGKVRTRTAVDETGVARAHPATLGPGLHWKWPWPIERMRRVSVAGVRELQLGGVGLMAHLEEFTWTEQHYQTEYEYLVATQIPEELRGEQEQVPVNLLAASSVVHFRLKDEGDVAQPWEVDEAVYNYCYRVANVRGLLESLAQREVARYMASVDIHEVMSIGRRAASAALRANIQQAVDAEQLGIKVVFVGLLGIHPPIRGDVGVAFQEVVTAEENLLSKVLTAEAYRNYTEMQVQGARAEILAEGQSKAFERMMRAEGEADRFGDQIEAYLAAPRVYPVREYLLAQQRSLGKIRKYILATDYVDQVVIPLEWQEVATPSIFDVDLSRPGQSAPAKEE